MLQLSKTIHVLALGLWFGSTVFFSFPVALSLFGTFEKLAEQDERPVWFPLAREFDQDPSKWKQPDSAPRKPVFENVQRLRKEQGTRAAGAAVGPLFGWYFLFQGVCGFLAVATALAWTRSQPYPWAHKVRVLILLAALGTVVAGWPLERMVGTLRIERNDASFALLQSAPEIPEAVYQNAADVRATFGTWHTYSLFLNFGTILLVTVAMALAAWLPAAGSGVRGQHDRSASAGGHPC